MITYVLYTIIDMLLQLMYMVVSLCKILSTFHLSIMQIVQPGIVMYDFMHQMFSTEITYYVHYSRASYEYYNSFLSM